MIYNKEMERYLNQIYKGSKVNEPNNRIDLCILQGINSNGEPYFYLEHNCSNLNNKSKVEFTGEMLTQLEWECNEIYINDSEDILCLLQTALFTIKSIRAILETQYSLQSFDIFMSIDDGKDFGVLPSATIRFYAIRNNNYISHNKSNLEEFTQPILIQSIN